MNMALKQYALLIQDTLEFLKKPTSSPFKAQKQLQLPIERKTNTSSSSPLAVPPPQAINEAIHDIPPKTETIQPSKNSALEEMKRSIELAAPKMILDTPCASCKIFVWGNNPEELLFLKKVQLAISQTLVETHSVFINSEKEMYAALKDPFLKLFLAPLDVLQKKYPHAKIHQIQKNEKGIAFLPLAKIALYPPDELLKRSLWNVLTSPLMRSLLQSC